MTYSIAIADHQSKEYAHVTEQEAEAIWLKADQPGVRLLFKTLWYTGLRINEILPLKASDLKYHEGQYSLMIVRLKKRKPKKEALPITTILGIDMFDYIKNTSMSSDTKIFPKHENTYRNQLRRCAEKADIRGWQSIHPHMFRHGFVYYHVSHGVHPFTLARLCGHSNMRITLDYYQPTEQDLRNVLDVRA